MSFIISESADHSPGADFTAVFVNKTGMCDNIAHFFHDSLWDVMMAAVVDPAEYGLPEKIDNFIVDAPGSRASHLYKWPTANASQWVDEGVNAAYEIVKKYKVSSAEANAEKERERERERERRDPTSSPSLVCRAHSSRAATTILSTSTRT